MWQSSENMIDDGCMQQLSKKTQAMASALGINFPTPLPLFRGSPNVKHLHDWAESQITPMARKIASKMVDNLQYITFEAFLKQLQTTINDFHQKINAEPYILLIGELRADKLAKGCSDQWIVGLAFEYCGLSEPAAILTPSQLETWRCSHPAVTKMLVLDDAVYSGEQKSHIWRYFRRHQKEIKSSELSVYLGFPYTTDYAKKSFSCDSGAFKEFSWLEHVIMPSTISALDDEELFYAKQAGIAHISCRHTLTYFDHRFADFRSCFQQIYKSSNLLMAHSVDMMHFSGFTFDAVRAQSVKTIQLITDVEQYNSIAQALTDPNNAWDCPGLTIPHIISPYKLREKNDKQCLADAIHFEEVGMRSPYPALDPDVAIILSKVTDTPQSFFSYKKTMLSLDKQQGYDKAVMRGNRYEITYDEQIGLEQKHKQILHELNNNPPVLNALKKEAASGFLLFKAVKNTNVFFVVFCALLVLSSVNKNASSDVNSPLGSKLT